MSDKLAMYDIVFLFSGTPLPAMLDMVAVSKQLGMNPILVLLDRGENDLVMDRSLIDYDVEVVPVPYKRIELSRISSLPKLWLKVNRLIRDRMLEPGLVVTNTLDTLLIASISRLLKNFEIRHQVRDLHSLQLEKGFLPSIVRKIEMLLMQKVSKLIVSSMEYYNAYYSNIYKGKVLLLENVPLKSAWHGFSRNSSSDGKFVIGYIGILRYKESIFQLINAVEELAESGMDIKVRFAGGSYGNQKEEVMSHISNSDLFEFSGAYEYARDIQRLYSDIDLIYAVYDSKVPNCQLAMPNKYYESIISKTPLLVAANTHVADRTSGIGIGCAVDLTKEGELLEILRLARGKGSWYRDAQAVLARLDPEAMYKEYAVAVRESVERTL